MALGSISTESASMFDVQHAQKAAYEHIENADAESLKSTPSHFEKLYLAPEHPVAGRLRLTFDNPASVALERTSVGNASVGIGSFYFLRAILLYLGGIGEWILGNTFLATVFLTFGGFWGTFRATLTPFFNAIDGYADPTTGKVDTAAFHHSFTMFLIFMALLCFLYLIAAVLTNICLVVVLFCFVITFPCLAASYFYSAAGMMSLSNTTRIVGAAFAFIASMVAWYLWFSMILEAVDFPIVLPVGDLSCYLKGRSDKIKKERELA